MASHASLAQEHCQARDGAIQHILLSLQNTIRSVPPFPNFGDLREKHWHCLTQTMILLPVPSPPSQPVGCVWVKDAIQVCGVRLMPAWHNTGQLEIMLFKVHSMA